MSRARIGRGFLGLGLLLITTASAARAVEPPGLRWEILPSSFPDAIPPTEFQEAASGAIFGTVVNTTETGLLHSGTGNVDFGLGSAQNETVVDAATIFQGGFCFPGPCGSTTVRWLDTATFHAPGVAAGAPGSFTAQLPTLGSLEAFVPNDWPNYAGTVILASYSILVYVDGILREAIQPSCTALPDAACVEAGKVRRYYPDPDNPSSFQLTALPSLFPVIPLGPYDFTFGEPLEIEVVAVANTSVHRGFNATGEPRARAVLFTSWGGLTSVTDGPGGTGDPVPIEDVYVDTASGDSWVRTPEPGSPAGAAAAILTSIAFVARRRRAAVPA
jgi:hypothetical protein